MFPLPYLASPGLCRALYHALDISHLEKIRPYYFLLVLFNISSENLVSNQLFFQLLITCLLESVRYCKEKLHPDQYWEWRFSIGQTNSKCTFLVTLRKKKMFKVRKPSWKVCWFLCKITMVVWHLCGSFILEGTSFKSFLFAVLPSYDTYSNREALRPQERTRTSTWRSTNDEFDSFVIPPVRQPTTDSFSRSNGRQILFRTDSPSRSNG